MRAPTLSEIHVGMKVEVVNCSNGTPKDNETAYWVATILKVNVNMMLLRYEGYEDDGVDDFWFDVRSKNVHPVGWCYSVQKLLIPPPGNVILTLRKTFLLHSMFPLKLQWSFNSRLQIATARILATSYHGYLYSN